MSIEFIGFTNKYYTLWECEYDGNECYYNYIQNLSMDFEKAKAKKPNACIDLTLRGHSSFRFSIPTFMFGKYKGQQINTCTDYDYLKWYHNIAKKEEIKRAIRPLLVEQGYKLWNGIYLFTEKEYERQKMLEGKFPSFNKIIKSNEPFHFNNKYTPKVVEDDGAKYKYIEIPFCKMFFNVNSYIPNGVVTIDEYEAEMIDPITYKFKIIRFH